jgi:3-hydroxyisobutyrate dehydrogenase-like beta-hydroxyacid dehydrogenase
MTSQRRTVGVLHPGEMGCAVAAQVARAGHRVLWASAGRGPATAERARAAGLEDAGSPAALAGQSEVILSICPPSAAVATAESLPGFRGVYVDANAVSPATSRSIERIVTRAGARFADGGIIGRPPDKPGDVRLYLSGPAAEEAGDLFRGTVIDAPVLTGGVGAASALKLAYAGWTKGSQALLLAVRALAAAENVEEDLVAEWRLSLPQLEERYLAARNAAQTKGWRWVHEMEEIADAMTADRLPDGFHRAAAAVFSTHSRQVP